MIAMITLELGQIFISTLMTSVKHMSQQQIQMTLLVSTSPLQTIHGSMDLSTLLIIAMWGEQMVI
ncbi:hypothetical protein D3D02_16590 [Halobellus sp. Atlit-38R]|nr:hypothetical protein D3D02_16590 [Halobellus sp. Atlit-38R]